MVKEGQKGLVTVTSDELSLVDKNLLNTQQLSFLMQPTPKKYVKKRPAKGGGEWSYVSGSYVKKVLNLIFGWDWDFKIIDYKFDLHIKQAFVHGELTCRIGERVVVKHQFGRVDIKFKTEWVENPNDKGRKMKQTTDVPLDLGNDLKAASTDALKKCAAELGVAADIYSPDEFRAWNVIDGEETENPLEELKRLFDEVETIPENERVNIQRIIENEETQNYDKAIRVVQKYTTK